MYKLKPSGQYKKDIKLCSRSNFDLSLMTTALFILKETGTLPVDEYKTHKFAPVRILIYSGRKTVFNATQKSKT